MTLRDWRAGQLRFLLAALMLSVAALSAVNFFGERMGKGLQRDAHQMLAADLVLASDQPLAPAWRAEAQRRGLRVAETVGLLSMAVADGAGDGGQGASLLVALKSVEPAYPLRGQLMLRQPAAGAAARAGAAGESDAAGTGPAPGTVWIDPALQLSLSLHQGSPLRIGERQLRVAGVIDAEPDAGAAFMRMAPRVMMASADLASTELLQQHAMARHRLLVAGEPAAVAGYHDWLKARFAADKLTGIQIDTLASGGSELHTMLDQAQSFLSLVSLLSTLLAALAVAMAARRFMLRHVDACAMLACLGLTQGQVLRLYLIEFLLLGLVGSAAGVLCGFGAHFLLAEWLGSLLGGSLPAPGWRPAAQGMATGMLLIAGFALAPLLQLRKVAPARLLRGERSAPAAGHVLAGALGLGMFSGLLVWQTGDLMLGLASAVGMLLAGLMFGALAWLALRALGMARNVLPYAVWRFAVTDMRRRHAATVAQIVALALGLTALLLMSLVRADLLASWRSATPSGAPNHFVINIQPDQKEQLVQRLAPLGAPQLHAMSRGRLLLVNGKSPLDANTPDAVREDLQREFDVGQASTLPLASTITAGSWYGGQGGQVSVDERLAASLKIALGDKLEFDMAAQPLTVTVTSLRKVDWRARQVSLPFLVHPRSMMELPLSWAAAVHVPDTQTGFAYGLAHDFPNLSVFDIASFLKQIRVMIDQLSAAVQFLFLFTLASGLLVLYAALAGSQDQRVRQAALLRALGATRKQLERAQWIEHCLTGALAGVLAASAATAASWALARFAFKLEWTLSPALWPAGLLAGAACALLGGWLGLRNVLNQAPLTSLRQV